MERVQNRDEHDECVLLQLVSFEFCIYPKWRDGARLHGYILATLVNSVLITFFHAENKHLLRETWFYRWDGMGGILDIKW